MQQVNLYLPEFQPKREPFLALHMAAIVGGVLVLLVIFTLVSVWQNSRLETQIATSQSQLDQLTTQVETLRKLQPRSQQARLEREIAHLENQIQRRKRIEKLIADQNLGNSAGFSQQLAAMARQYIDSLSIQHFALKQGGSYAEFSGWARRAEQVPLYIRQLREEPSFENVGFGVLTIEKSKQRRDALEFKVVNPDQLAEEDAS